MAPSRTVGALVAAVSLGAAAVLASSVDGIAAAVEHHTATLLVLCGLTVALQALSLAGFASSISVAGVGMLATGFVLGVGPAVLTAVLAALVHALKKRPRPYKVLFNSSMFALAAAGGTAAFAALRGHDLSSLASLLGAQLGACVFLLVNVGLLTLAMAASEQRSPLAVWKERLAWLTFHYLAFGPLALAIAVIEKELGPAGLAAAALLPVALTLLVRESLTHLRARRTGRAPLRAW